jgi:hypothetical protein
MNKKRNNKLTKTIKIMKINNEYAMFLKNILINLN